MYSFVFYLLFAKSTADDMNIRGIESNDQHFYIPSKDFTCLDGSRSISFTNINDDYCDCLDGSDEPGTSACPQGRFYCPNMGFKAKYIPSSRVNDGICDCCDGSDEYENIVACANECNKLGVAEQEMRKEEMAEIIEGAKVRTQYVLSGKEKMGIKVDRIKEINKRLEEKRKELDEASVAKDAAEKPEKEAKDKHHKEKEEESSKKKAEEEENERNNAFGVIDVNKDEKLSIAEILSTDNLDMTAEERTTRFSLEEEMNREGFFKIWKDIKDKFRQRKTADINGMSMEETVDLLGNNEKQVQEDVVPPGEIKVLSDEEKEKEMDKLYEDYDDEDDKIGDNSGGSFPPGDDKEELDMQDKDEEEEDDNDDMDDDDLKLHDEKSQDDHEYGEEVKELIAKADKARAMFDEVDKSLKELEREKKEIEEYIGIDFGKDDEFSVLKGQCFEFTDREYTYKLCPFENVTQRNKNGGSDTDLGNKMDWIDKEKNGYTIMKYTDGETCWNGPSRSTTVFLSCGKENILTYANEPSRCEYEMGFKTPSLCEGTLNHDEL